MCKVVKYSYVKGNQRVVINDCGDYWYVVYTSPNSTKESDYMNHESAREVARKAISMGYVLESVFDPEESDEYII